MKKINVAVLGASAKQDRYSNQAVKLLSDSGYTVIPVHPSGITVNGLETFKHLSDISIPIDTLTIYVNASLSYSLSVSIKTLINNEQLHNLIYSLYKER